MLGLASAGPAASWRVVAGTRQHPALILGAVDVVHSGRWGAYWPGAPAVVSSGAVF